MYSNPASTSFWASWTVAVAAVVAVGIHWRILQRCRLHSKITMEANSAEIS
jgi:hypothetical protein